MRWAHRNPVVGEQHAPDDRGAPVFLDKLGWSRHSQRGRVQGHAMRAERAPVFPRHRTDWFAFLISRFHNTARNDGGQSDQARGRIGQDEERRHAERPGCAAQAEWRPHGQVYAASVRGIDRRRCGHRATQPTTAHRHGAPFRAQRSFGEVDEAFEFNAPKYADLSAPPPLRSWQCVPPPHALAPVAPPDTPLLRKVGSHGPRPREEHRRAGAAAPGPPASLGS